LFSLACFSASMTLARLVEAGFSSLFMSPTSGLGMLPSRSCLAGPGRSACPRGGPPSRLTPAPSRAFSASGEPLSGAGGRRHRWFSRGATGRRQPDPDQWLQGLGRIGFETAIEDRRNVCQPSRMVRALASRLRKASPRCARVSRPRTQSARQGAGPADGSRYKPDAPALAGAVCGRVRRPATAQKKGLSTLQDGSRLGEPPTKVVWRPRPAWCLWGSRTETGGFLSRWIGNGGGNEEGQVGRTDSLFYLQPLRRPLPVLIMGFVIDPLTKEKLFFRGQFHLASSAYVYSEKGSCVPSCVKRCCKAQSCDEVAARGIARRQARCWKAPPARSRR
jgi:hypothetical protein